jgi:hypothetical protein
MRIIVGGKAFVYDADRNEVTSSEILRSLDALAYDEETFTDYLGNRDTSTIQEMLAETPDDKGLLESFRESQLENSVREALEPGGKLRFSYKPDVNELWCITEYRSRRRLNDDELKMLADYTEGQWSDGIGENFSSSSQEVCGYLIDCGLCGPNFSPILKASVEQAEE